MENQLCKLFVGGLNVQTTDDGLRNHFEQYGTLTDCVVVQNQQLKRSRCFGFVTYSSPEEGGTRPWRPDRTFWTATTSSWSGLWPGKTRANPRPSQRWRRYSSAGLKTISRRITSSTASSSSARWRRRRVITDKETGKKRGFGFVYFEDNDSADKAVVLKYHVINGHKVEVKKALTKQEMQATGGRGGRGGRGGGRGMGRPQNGYGGRGSGYGKLRWRLWRQWRLQRRLRRRVWGRLRGPNGGLYGGGNGYNDFGSGYGQQSSGYGPMKGNYSGRSKRSLLPRRWWWWWLRQGGVTEARIRSVY